MTTETKTDSDVLSRRSFVSNCGQLSFTAVALSSLPLASMLTGCGSSEFYKIHYFNWSDGIDVYNVQAVKPANESDLVRIVDWCKANGYKVRAFGKMHTWCPITIPANLSSNDKTVLLDMSKFDSLEMTEQQQDYGVIKIGAGATLETMHRYLAEQTSVCSAGYGFSNYPAPGELTVGGALAIGCHGTAVPYNGSDEDPNLFGSLSNKILSMTIVAYNAANGKYELKTLNRDDPEMAAFMVHLGRTLVTSVTLQAAPTFNLRCVSILDQTIDDVLAPNATDNAWTIGNILDTWGRSEIIWFPYTDKPWVKVWQRADTPAPTSRLTTRPYNYTFSDNLPKPLSDTIRGFLRTFPDATEAFGKFGYVSAQLGLNGGLNSAALANELQNEGVTNSAFINFFSTLYPNTFTNSADLWGPAWHTMLYVKATTLRMHANGYAVRLPRNQVQGMLHDFKNFYKQLLASYKARGVYPTAGPVEIRFNGLDYTDDIRTPNAVEPTYSALSPSDDNTSDDIVTWIDVLTFIDTRENWPFFKEVEDWLLANYGGRTTRGEWSKGWGYTRTGAWTNADYLSNLPATFAGTQNSYQAGIQTLDKYDPDRLFSAPIHEAIFPR